MTDGDLFQSITTSNSASPDPLKGRPRVFLKTDHRLFCFVLDEAMLQCSAISDLSFHSSNSKIITHEDNNGGLTAGRNGRVGQVRVENFLPSVF
jgi:hypothetical protein